MASSLSPSSKIIIVGSGVFGLSTALWLGKSGYRDVTVLDMQDTESSLYDPRKGIDSASADLNKIIRFSYGTEIEYQRLASEAAVLWNEWNEKLANASEDELPKGLKHGERKLWYNSGSLRMSATAEFGEFELRTLENMTKDGIRQTQLKSDVPSDVERAKANGWYRKLDPCKRQERFGIHKAVLDTTAGFVVAYRSCAWAQYLARQQGVKFILGPLAGKATSIVDGANGGQLVQTADGISHAADFVVVAGGAWTPSLIPDVSSTLEATAGSVCLIQIPKDRADLMERFSPENMPVVTWGMKEGKGVYSFPRTEDGIIKIGYRATKYTNFDDVNGRRISSPKTAHVTEKKEKRIPLKALNATKEFISLNFPELIEFGISETKLCWYTDSIDNSFVVDYVPGRSGLVVCSGGSGHGFKFLPILGREVVKILEGKGNETVYGKMWKWRISTAAKRNGLEEGESGPRVMAKSKMATEADWKFTASSKL